MKKSVGLPTLFHTNSSILNLISIQNVIHWEAASMFASIQGEEFVADTNEGHSWRTGENTKASSQTDFVTSTSCRSVGSCSDLSSSS